MTYQENVALAELASFRIGGVARQVWPLTDVASAVEAHERSLTTFPLVLGGGTNVLLPDQPLDLVWHVVAGQAAPEQIGSREIRVWAGTPTAGLAWSLIREGVGGLEKFTSLPGTIGGAVWGNAHGDGELISTHVTAVEVMDINSGEIETLTASECQFGYDNSVFKERNEWLILQVSLRVVPDSDPAVLTALAREYAAHKRQTQDLSAASAGCFWQNPRNTPELRLRFPEFAHRERFPVGFLIEQIRDRVGVNERVGLGQHANFIINRGGATNDDVRTLAEQIAAIIYVEYGVRLQPEVAVYA